MGKVDIMLVSFQQFVSLDLEASLDLPCFCPLIHLKVFSTLTLRFSTFCLESHEFSLVHMHQTEIYQVNI